MEIEKSEIVGSVAALALTTLATLKYQDLSEQNND